jgi:16S rRNA (cytosine967-C5)-methyltransferase
MSVSGSQKRVFLQLAGQLQPPWRRDPALPTRIQALLARHREFGSRDRRLYRELVYTMLRYLPWIEPLLAAAPDEAVRRVAWLAADSSATRAFRAAFASGEPPVGSREELLPAWFREHRAELYSGAELDAQLRRAPLWLRLQTPEPERVLDEFDQRGWPWRRSEAIDEAVELRAEVDATLTAAWRAGWFEVQDLGSQMILRSADVEPGGRWLDACAGAGGKTLQLAHLLGPAGEIDTYDVRRAALVELAHRARRAGIRHTGEPPAPAASPSPIGREMARIRVLDALPKDRYQNVLVDAPCSGSGTWRRAPHLKWVTSEAQIVRAAETQLALLEQLSASVAPGGQLVYATCSLSCKEDEEVVAAFLARHGDFGLERSPTTFGHAERGGGLLILPARHDTDGFFVAILRRTRRG